MKSIHPIKKKWRWYIILPLKAIVLMMLIDHFLWGICFPQLWQSALFSTLAGITSCVILFIQFKAISKMEARWRQSHSLRVFLPAPKTLLSVILGLPIFYLFIAARTTPLTELSWSVVRYYAFTQPSVWHLQVALLVGVLIYAIGLSRSSDKAVS